MIQKLDALAGDGIVGYGENLPVAVCDMQVPPFALSITR